MAKEGPEQSPVQDAPPKRAPKTEHTPADDVAKESYKGPGMTVSAAGGAFIAHWVASIAALFVGLAAGYIFHKPIMSQVSKWQKWGQAAIAENKTGGKFINWLFGSGKKITAHDVAGVNGEAKKEFTEFLTHKNAGFLNRVTKDMREWWGVRHVVAWIPEERLESTIVTGGLLSTITFGLSTLLFGGRGAQQAVQGKQQFTRAKDEIWTLRAEYDSLREKYLRTKLELEDARTTQNADQGQLTISKDEPPKLNNNQEQPTAPPEVATNQSTPRRREEQGTQPGSVVTSVSREAARAAPLAQGAISA